MAVPSFVIPGTVAQNAYFLAGKVAEIGLCLFEWRSCLEYGTEDLPPSLANLNLSWHAHLPLDLPWHSGAGTVAGICRQIAEKIAFLQPRFLVLHPPAAVSTPHKKTILGEFIDKWSAHPPILLENTEDCDVIELGPNFLAQNSFGFCLDAAHALGYSQKALLASGLPEIASLIHWSAPGGGDRHLPLDRLDCQEAAQARIIMSRLSPGAVQMLEIFSWRGIVNSLPAFADLRNLARVDKK